MDPIFCCIQAQPYKPQRLDHELKFTEFLAWAKDPNSAATSNSDDLEKLFEGGTYVIQVVRQVNYGALESKRYFVKTSTTSGNGTSIFQEVTESDLIQANFEKLNSFKNFKCSAHDKFFEINVYQKDPVNTHHWRANIARPAGEIDL